MLLPDFFLWLGWLVEVQKAWNSYECAFLILFGDSKEKEGPVHKYLKLLEVF